MFLHLLRRNNVFALGFCLLLQLLLWAPRLWAAFTAGDSLPVHPLPPSLWLPLSLPPALPAVAAFLCTFAGAWLLLLLNNRHLFQGTGEYLLPLLYVLTASAIPDTQWFSGVQVAMVIFCIGLNYLLHAHHRAKGFAELFTAGFCFSLAALCFPPLLPSLLLLPAGILVLRAAAWRDWVVSLTALLLPPAYAFLYFWQTLGNAAAALATLKVLLPGLPAGLPAAQPATALYLAATALLLLAAMLGGLTRQTGMRVKILHVRTLFLWELLFLLPGSLFYPHCGYLLLPVIALPVAVLTANYLSQPKARKLKIACWLLWLSAIIYLQVAEFL